MDLNTGTPIQGSGGATLPPIPQQSTGLPVTQTNPPVQNPAAVSTPVTDSSIPAGNVQDVKKPSFLNPLETLKKLTNQGLEENASVPAPSVPSVEQPNSTLPLIQGVPTVENVVMPTVESNGPAIAPVVDKLSDLPSVSPVSQPTTEVHPATTAPAPMPQSNTGIPDIAYATPGTMDVQMIKAPYDLKAMLDLVVQKEASDLHLVVGYTPSMRYDGALVSIGDQILTPEMAKALVYSVLPDDKKEQLEVNREVDLAYQHGDLGRFRINAYWQRGYISAAFRLIPTRIRSLDELNLPEIFSKFPDMEQGLVLVTGPTGHGKSTTLAALIQEINRRHAKHIITIEDPIEYIFPQQKALVSQRELGDDTHSWKGALRSALREDPDVVLVGEMRDLETISAAITLAETGHLVFATLHTNNAAQTIQRIVNAYPEGQQEEIRTELADVLEAVVAQRLIPVKGGGRRAAVEIMLMTPAIRNLIRENKIHQIDNVIRTSLDLGMTTLERSLIGLYKDGLISQEEALRYALDPTEMARLLEELL